MRHAHAWETKPDEAMRRLYAEHAHAIRRELTAKHEQRNAHDHELLERLRRWREQLERRVVTESPRS